jgi:hypothetical protein
MLAWSSRPTTKVTCEGQVVDGLVQLVEADGEPILDCAVPFQSDRLVFFLYCNAITRNRAISKLGGPSARLVFADLDSLAR